MLNSKVSAMLNSRFIIRIDDRMLSYNQAFGFWSAAAGQIAAIYCKRFLGWQLEVRRAK